MKVFYIAKSYIVLLILPVLLMASTVIYAFNRDNKLDGKVIVIDAGHGGIDPGANRPGVLEKDINLSVALQLKGELNEYGAKVVLSRQLDTELSGECDNEKVKGRYHRDLMARVELAEESDADLFVSIHANAVKNTKRHGAEVFYCKNSDQGKMLADSVQVCLNEVAGVNRAAQDADYFVLRRNKIPTVLIEVGYITNSDERTLLQSPEYQLKIAKAIAKGVHIYYQ